MVTGDVNAITVFTLAPARHTESYGTSPPQIFRPSTPGRSYVIEMSVRPIVCVTDARWLPNGTVR